MATEGVRIRLNHLSRIGFTAAVVLTIVSLTAAEAAEGVLTKRRVNEFGGVSGRNGGNRYLAWAQSPIDRGRRTKVMARRNGNTFRASARGTRAFTGGITGDLLIYQQINNGQSDLMGFNLRTRNRFEFSGPSTRDWEFRPTMSGRWILFARDFRLRDTVVLYNRNTQQSRQLAEVRTRNGRRGVLPGQVNGKWVVYHKCNRQGCDVFRYNIRTRNTMRIPSRRPYQYVPSVAPDGDVYFVASGRACGSRVQLLRRRNGKTTKIARLGQKDSFDTYAGPAPGTRTDVLFSKIRCADNGTVARRPRADVYKVRVR
ncbi:MAG: hypothetical protein M3280_07000 [Actinomycetota bacterium]|nr:hypothetical protein [Actinomycetota bacterium]